MENDRIENRKRIGRKIADIRKRKGLTTIQLAELTGLQQSNINRIELGKYSADIDLIGKVAAALNFKIDFVEN